MSDDSRLRWVWQNRKRVPRERLVGDLLAFKARELQSGEEELARGVASAIAGIVDQDFMRHCRIGSLSNGAIVVNVDEPALVCPMRLRWLDVLSGALRRSGPGRAIRSIVFRYDKAGVVIRQ